MALKNIRILCLGFLCVSLKSLFFKATKNKGVLSYGFLCFMLFNLSTAQAQSPENGEAAEGQTEIKPLLIGQKVPEEFWTREYLFYVDGDTVRKTLEEYRGKLLILDFWATWCGPCLKGFGHLEKISKIYKTDLHIVLVNAASTKDSVRGILDTYQQTTEKYWGGSLPTIMKDRYLESLFPHVGVPFAVWINARGTVYSFTRAPLIDGGVLFNILKSGI